MVKKYGDRKAFLNHKNLVPNKIVSNYFKDEIMSRKLLDYQEALVRLGGDEEFLNELLHELLIQIDQNFDEIKEAIESKNFEELKALSHSLKGASANLNVTRIANHFLNLEDLGNSNSIEGASDILELVGEDRNELEVFLNRN